MIRIQQATLADLPTLAYITKEAYSGNALDLRTLELYFAIQPDGAFLALKNGRPAGMVFIFDYQHFASVGVLGVLPAFQNQGIGRYLMEHLEAWAKSRNIPALILDATPEGATLYEKLGYKDVDVNYRLNLLEQKQCAVPEHLETITLNHLEEILEFDQPIFGANRKPVLEVFLSEYAERGFISRDAQRKIDGFILTQEATIGPWVAKHATVAEQLLHAVLGLGLSENTRVMLPGQIKRD